MENFLGSSPFTVLPIYRFTEHRPSRLRTGDVAAPRLVRANRDYRVRAPMGCRELADADGRRLAVARCAHGVRSGQM